MSSIGSGPGISPAAAVEVSAVRAVGSSDPNTTIRSGGAAPPAPSDAAAPAAPVVTRTALDAGAAPIDQDRVATIRKAIESDSYPLVPTKIGDAIIAAGMLLRMPQ